MAVFFLDLDGTIFEHGTNNFLPGAQERLEKLKADGHQVVITTRRGIEFEGHRVYDRKKTIEALNRLNVPHHAIVFDLKSPRIVINDEGAYGINVETNGEATWDIDDAIQVADLKGEDNRTLDIKLAEALESLQASGQIELNDSLKTVVRHIKAMVVR